MADIIIHRLLQTVLIFNDIFKLHNPLCVFVVRSISST